MQDGRGVLGGLKWGGQGKEYMVKTVRAPSSWAHVTGAVGQSWQWTTWGLRARPPALSPPPAAVHNGSKRAPAAVAGMPRCARPEGQPPPDQRMLGRCKQGTERCCRGSRAALESFDADELRGSTAEPAEATCVIVAAVHAAHPEYPVLGLQQHGLQICKQSRWVKVIRVITAPGRAWDLVP